LISLARSVVSELSAYLDLIIRNFPGAVGSKLRYLYIKFQSKQCGQGVFVHYGCIFRGGVNMNLGDRILFGPMNQVYAGITEGDAFVQIGNGCHFNSNVMINADLDGKILIGENVMLGPNVVVRASNHNYSKRDVPMYLQGHSGGEIIIEDDVWVGANAVLLPNIRIGKGAVVGAGSVVTKNIEPYTIVGGIPAKRIGFRGDTTS
jgi:galactoside O-acetyltransferase